MADCPTHGKDCHKASHGAEGYLHLPEDDGPYDVDGYLYCGRCHVALFAEPTPPREAAIQAEKEAIAAEEGIDLPRTREDYMRRARGTGARCKTCGGSGMVAIPASYAGPPEGEMCPDCDSDPSHAAFVAQVKKTRLPSDDTWHFVRRVVNRTSTFDYAVTHGWPATLTAIAEALQEEGK